MDELKIYGRFKIKGNKTLKEELSYLHLKINMIPDVEIAEFTKAKPLP